MITEVLSESPQSVLRAIKLLSSGEVVALPTETVYGLAGNAFDPESVTKIFTAKERPTFDPLIVHLSSKVLEDPTGPIDALVKAGILSDEILHWSARTQIELLMKKYWPGPLTLILPRGKNIPDLVTSGEPTVGVRMPAHPLFQKILAALPFPLAAPSANRFGRISPTEAFHVETELEGRISAILDGGACEVGVESTILRIEEPFRATLLRPGKIGASELEAELKTPIEIALASGQENQAQLAPGLLDQHYAPRKPLFLIPERVSTPEELSAWAQKSGLNGKYGFLSQCSPYPVFESGPAAITLTLSMTNDSQEIARNLFSYLRSLDEYSEIDFILADLHPNSKSGLLAAIADRLNRASLNKPLKSSI